MPLNNTSPTLRTCRTCNIEKPLADFYVQDGRHRWHCKPCVIAKSRAYVLKHHEQKIQYLRDYYRDNKEKVLAQQREYYQENAEERKEYQRRYQAKNTDKIKQRRHRYYLRNRDRIKRKTAAWSNANRERCNEHHRRWKKANTDAVNIITARRRARLISAEGRFTRKEWKDMKEHYGYKCLRCGRVEPEISLTMDHIVALVNGGRHDADNIQPLCRSCNARKHTKTQDYRINFKETPS